MHGILKVSYAKRAGPCRSEEDSRPNAGMHSALPESESEAYALYHRESKFQFARQRPMHARFQPQRLFLLRLRISISEKHNFLAQLPRTTIENVPRSLLLAGGGSQERPSALLPTRPDRDAGMYPLLSLLGHPRTSLSSLGL